MYLGVKKSAASDFDIKTFIGFIFCQIIAVALCLKFSFYTVIFIFGTLFLFYSLKHTFLSINVLILSHILIIQSTETVSIPEVMVGVYLFLILTIWFFKKVFINHEPFKMDNSEVALLLFMLACIFSIIPGFLYGVPFLKWFRELVPFLPLLLIFPLRDSIKDKKHVYIIMLTTLVICIATAVHNLITYRIAVHLSEMYWQITASRETSNEPVLFVPLIIAISILLFSDSKKIKMCMVFLAAVFGISLIVTFSRGYWIAAAIALFVLFILTPPKVKLRIAVYLGILIGFSSIVIFSLFGDFGELIIDSVYERFITLQSFLQDPSIKNRILESEALIRLVRVNPIIGYGLGKYYKFNSILPREMPTAYIHNAFLFLFYKIGILGSLFFLFFYGKTIYNGIVVSKIQQDPIIKATIIGITSYLIAMLPLSFSSPQFYQKDSVLLITIGIAIIRSQKLKINWPTDYNEAVQ